MNQLIKNIFIAIPLGIFGVAMPDFVLKDGFMITILSWIILNQLDIYRPLKPKQRGNKWNLIMN